MFDVSVVHDLLHMGFGFTGMALVRTFATARGYLIAGGAVSLVLFGYGLLIDPDSSANVVPVNDAENWLHLGLASPWSPSVPP